MPEEINIIGGGLSGLSLGIRLRQNGVPVTVVEAGAYPRHKVCGEFICGAGARLLEGLDLELSPADFARAETASFYSATKREWSVKLHAVCVSRERLDAAMASRFLKLGGRLLVETPFRGGFDSPNLVRASGRKREALNSGNRWFGLKAHATQVQLESDLEMHFVPAGYVGLCSIGRGVVNVCGCFRRGTEARGIGPKLQLLTGEPGSLLRERLRNAEFFSPSISAVAGLPLNRRSHTDMDGEFRVGDALAMIPPLTGNGMSIALESSELAQRTLNRCAREELTWDEARLLGESDYRTAFNQRLGWAHLLHVALLCPALRAQVFALARKWPAIGRLVIARTR